MGADTAGTSNGAVQDAGVDTNAPADAAAEKAMTFDEMRQYTIAYLNDTIPTAEGRKTEFRSILDVFNAVKLGDIAAEKFPLVIAEVDRRKAAAAAAKKAG